VAVKICTRNVIATGSAPRSNLPTIFYPLAATSRRSPRRRWSPATERLTCVFQRAHGNHTERTDCLHAKRSWHHRGVYLCLSLTSNSAAQSVTVHLETNSAVGPTWPG